LSALEDQFLSLWLAHCPSITLEREYSDIEAWERDYQERYAKSKRSKRYRLDFAHPFSRTGIEIQGGVYSRGRHVTGSGYERDCKKYNLAYTMLSHKFAISMMKTEKAIVERKIVDGLEEKEDEQ
jgi:hypothetical protein